MEYSEFPKRVTDYKPEGRRSIRRPILCWMDGVTKYLKKLDVKNWWTAAGNRE